MNLLGPDHRTSRAAVQSLARLAAGRVWRLNKDIFLLIRPSVVCPPRRRCTCSSQCLMYVFSSSSIRSVSQPSLTVFLLLLLSDPNHPLDTTPSTSPHHPPALPSSVAAFDYRLWLQRRRGQIYRNFISHLSLTATCTCASSQRLHRQSLCAPAAVHASPCKTYLLFKRGWGGGRGLFGYNINLSNTLASSKMNVIAERLHFRLSPRFFFFRSFKKCLICHCWGMQSWE